MKKRNEKGSALVLVLTASVFLIILTAGAFRYFQTNAATQIWTKERIQAKLSAEAGVNLATHMLIAGAALPTTLDPEPFLGTEASYYVLPGEMGTVYVCVDPSNENPKITTANAFMIRCIANISGSTMETFGLDAIVMPENLARFAVFQDDPGGGYYADGYRFDGPFYANGPINIYSSSATHENDVFFYSYKSTSPFWVYGTSSAGSHQTTPAAGNLEMRPYQRLLLGAPYFELNADTISFGSGDLNWQGVRSAAISDGLYLTTTDVPNYARLALKNDTLFVQKNAASVLSPDTFPLGGLVNPVVWIENASNHNIYLRGSAIDSLDMALTIGCYGTVLMSGPLYYEDMDLQDPDNTDMLGVITVNGNIWIADDPDVNEPNWLGHFSIMTEGTFTYCAVLVALDGIVKAENPYQPAGVFEFQVLGGYMCQAEGHTNNEPSPTYPLGTGFSMGVYFDPRLLFSHPPFFPTTANWNTTMWAERADMTQADVTNGPNPAY